MLQESFIHHEKQSSFASSVRSATNADIESAIALLMMAFSADPVARWVYPDPGDYVRYFPEFIRAFAGRAFENGNAYVASGLGGAALWLPPRISPDEGAVIDLFERSVIEPVKKDLYEVFEAMGEYHPREPHWYLPMIGVDVAKQGTGIGSALMEFAVERCDSDGLPAYLESSNPRNISLYERFGFDVIGTIQYGDSAPMFPMLRKPR